MEAETMLEFSFSASNQRIQISGFTLIELLVTLSIIGILSVLALPSFSEFVGGQRVKTASFEVFSSLTYARSEAIKRNAEVAVTSASGGWQNGWTVAVVNGSTLNQQTAFTGLTIAGPAGSITYNGSGRLKASVTPFTISSSTGTSVSPRCISIDLSGRPNSKIGNC